MKKNLVYTFFLCFSVSLCYAQQTLEGVAAIVGKQIILKSEVAQIVQMTAINMGLDPQDNDPRLEKLSKDVLMSLVDQRVVLEIAEAESVIVNKQEVDAALDRHFASVLSRVGSEKRLEEAFGKTIRELKKELWPEIRDQLIVERFQSQMLSGVHVSRKEVEGFFSTYEDSIGVLPELYDLQWLRLTITPGSETKRRTVEKLKNLRSRILSGEDFGSIASQYSHDPGSARNGGELGFTTRGTLVPEYEEVAIDLSEGEISGIVESPFGYHIIQTIGRMGEKINTRHILLTPKPSEADEDSVYALAKALADSIKDVADLSNFARRYSDDELTKESGGHLGYQPTSSLPYPGLARILPSLPVNEVSDPIWVETAYVILMINDIRPGGAPTLKEHWTEIQSMALEKKKSDFFSSWLNKKSSSVYIRTFE